ncbi:cell division ATP-binding protein FtsE [Flagellimonas sp. GZD32]|uniref:cell division ATP-binding protein FtsE n=1 Tax=Flagellimonas cixiensis TaxID=3228750 RepID=UPI0035C8930C
MPETIVKLQDVAVFQNENLVLNHINLEVKKGDFVYVIGKTGSGKSSFMKTLYADIPFKQGTGQVVDFDLATLKEKDIPFLRRKLGIVFQDFKLLPDRNINNNLEFVLKATGWTDPIKMKDKIEEVLDKVGMKTKGFKFPHELSGGEQQRIAIARALLNDPELILADEPTGNLDPQTSVEVMKVLQDINQNGRTIIMATHDYALILKYPHKTLKCDGSKLFEVIQKAI